MATKRTAKTADTTNTPVNSMTEKSNIIDVDFSVIQKKRFRLNGDNTKIFELNTSDMGIVSRITEAYPKLNELQARVSELAIADDEEDEEALAKVGETLKSIDNEMRVLIDFVFDAKVADLCADGGSMYDPFGGIFRYEHVLDKLFSLYENNLTNEFKQMKARVDKYAKK